MSKWVVMRNGRILGLLLVLLLGLQPTVIALSPVPQAPAQEPAPTDDVPDTATPTPDEESGGIVVTVPQRATPTPIPSPDMLEDTAVITQPASATGAPAGWFTNRDCEQELRLMFMGNSITRGKGSSLPPGGNRENEGPYNFGYRYYLEESLDTDGYQYDFVGQLTHGISSTITFENRWHNGFAGIEAQELADLLLDPGSFRLYGGYGAYGDYGPYGTSYQPLLTEDPSDVILLHIGTNDVSKAGFNVNTEVGDVAEILDKIDTYSEEVVVILALIIDQDSTADGYDAGNVEAFNTALNAMAQTRITGGDKIVVVDMFNTLDPLAGDYFDRLHPSNAGFAKMEPVWFTALQNIWPTCVEITSSPLLMADASQPYAYVVTAVADPAPVTYSLINPPTGMSIHANTGQISWTPTVAQMGTHQIEVQATNGHQTDTQQFTIAVDGYRTFIPTIIKN